MKPVSDGTGFFSFAANPFPLLIFIYKDCLHLAITYSMYFIINIRKPSSSIVYKINCCFMYTLFDITKPKDDITNFKLCFQIISKPICFKYS